MIRIICEHPPCLCLQPQVIVKGARKVNPYRMEGKLPHPTRSPDGRAGRPCRVRRSFSEGGYQPPLETSHTCSRRTLLPLPQPDPVGNTLRRCSYGGQGVPPLQLRPSDFQPERTYWAVRYVGFGTLRVARFSAWARIGFPVDSLTSIKDGRVTSCSGKSRSWAAARRMRPASSPTFSG